VGLQAICRRTVACFDDYDLFVSPTMSLPLAMDDAGLPVGVQVVGRPAAEATLVRVSVKLEAAIPWIDRRPPVS